MSAPASPVSPTPRLRLRVSKAAELHVREGHPWVYESSVREQNREGEAGEFAVIYDRRDRFLAIGLYDPHSPLRVRVLHSGLPTTLDDAWWAARLDTALARRAALFGPLTAFGDTDGYRVVGGESDGFPGLVVDRYAGVLVLKLYTAAWFAHLRRVLELLAARAPGFGVVLRLSRNIQALAADLGTTRTAAALELWRDRLEGAVVAIGNAPTALFHLLEMVAAGGPRPAAVLGIPVGFIGAAESKDALAASDLDFLVVRGRRGGSAITPRGHTRVTYRNFYPGHLRWMFAGLRLAR